MRVQSYTVINRYSVSVIVVLIFVVNEQLCVYAMRMLHVWMS